jgi:hypothetical protein
MWCTGAVAALLTGCPGGDDGESVGSADTGDTDGTTVSTSATSTTASTTESTTASTTDSTTSPMTTTASMTTTPTTDTDPTDTDADTTDTDTGGVACGELSCGGGEYCDWGVNSCGADRYDEPMCAPLPDGCPGIVEHPVCGCDGVVYSGECAASVLGVDVDESGACPAPGGLFQCGYKYCDPEISYCQIQYSDIGGYPHSYGCMPLPDGCGGEPGCECLADELCGSSCEAGPDGGYIVSCAGG